LFMKWKMKQSLGNPFFLSRNIYYGIRTYDVGSLPDNWRFAISVYALCAWSEASGCREP
jgi:hypothetical protein